MSDEQFDEMWARLGSVVKSMLRDPDAKKPFMSVLFLMARSDASWSELAIWDGTPSFPDTNWPVPPPDLLERLRKVQVVLVNEMNNGFSEEGGTDHTKWSLCKECDRSEWQGHDPDCIIGNAVRDMVKIIDELGS